MKELLNKLREANISLTKEDFIDACNQTDLFKDYVDEIDNNFEGIKVHQLGNVVELVGFNLYLINPRTFTNIMSDALRKYVDKHIPDVFIAETLFDETFGLSENVVKVINDLDYNSHLNSVLLDVKDSVPLSIEEGFAKVTVDGTEYILLG